MSKGELLISICLGILLGLGGFLWMVLPVVTPHEVVILTTIGMDRNGGIVIVNRGDTFPDMDSCLVLLHQKDFTNRPNEISYCDPQGDPK